MPEHRESVTQPYRPEQLFDLVLDVERYPEFVPGYHRVRATPGGSGELLVDQTVRFGPAPVHFRSIARAKRPQEILIRSVDGPLRELSVEWRFTPVAGGCRIDFRAAYEVDAGPLRSILRGWFADMSHRILQSFIERAHQQFPHGDTKDAEA